MSANRKKANALVIFIIIVVLLLFTFVTAKNSFEKSPEFAIYKCFIAAKAGNYDEFLNYVDIDSITDKYIDYLKEDFINLPEVRNFPDKQYALRMFDRMAEAQKEKEKEKLERDIKSKKLLKEFENIPNIVFLLGIIVKKHDKYEIQVAKREKIANIKGKENGKTRLEIVLEQRNGKWIITDIINDEIKEQIKKAFKSSYASRY